MKDSKHQAADSALGYYHQAMYGLIVLLDAGDDEAVSIETRDDIEVVGPTARLLQLKHSLRAPPALTERNSGLWKTLGIWIAQCRSGDLHFLFVTCAEVQPSSSLVELTREGSDRRGALDALEKEAARVVMAVEKFRAGSKRTKGKQPYADRIEACQALVALARNEREALVKRIKILHRSFNVTQLESEVEKRLMSFTKQLRPLLARRLMEWWDPRVARSLSGQSSRTIAKGELLTRLEHLVIELADDNLPDDFGLATPPNTAAGLGSVMVRQIEIVDGGPQRVTRAAIARWRARSQRARWLSERIEVAEELKRYDDGLVECWQARHAPLQHDCRNKSEAEQVAVGRQLLDWSHNDASREVQQPRHRWTGAFLTQGSYQQLAEEKRVGWHPEYEARLGPPNPGSSAGHSAAGGGVKSKSKSAHSRGKRRDR